LKTSIGIALTGLMLVILLAACTVPVTPSPSAGTTPTTVATVAKPAWQQKWDGTLAEAKKEGKLTVYTLWGPEVTNPVSQAFKAKYGIEVEFANLGRGSALLPKVDTENRAGLYLADAYGFGASTLVTSMKPIGALGPLEPMLILPEVADPKAWTGDQVPYMDKEKLVIGMLASPQRFISYNTDMIKDGELAGYKDLVKPQYKGKIAMGDPSLTGAPNALFTHLGFDLWSADESIQYLRQLLTQQDAVLSSDGRQIIEWVARGKYALGLAGQQQAVAEFVALGAPINVLIQKEGHLIDAAGGALSVPKKMPHPNATVIFVNWLLTKEGETLLAKGYGFPSLLKAASTEGISPILLAKPGEKLFPLSEEQLIARGPAMEAARKVIQDTRVK